MALGKRLINTGGAAVCTTDTADIFGDSNGVALYNLDYDASDASGNYDGTPTNVDFGVDGQINYGARFNGSNSGIFLTTSGNSVLDYDNDFSVSMWFKATSLNASESFNNLWTAGGTRIIPMQVSVSSGVIFAPYDGTNHIVSTGSSSISLNQWYNVVATRSKTSGLKIYLNGVLKDTDSFTGNASSLSQRDTIGQYWDGTRNSFAGNIDQVRIFSKALNQSEVDTLYAETACVYTATTTDNDYPTTNLAYYKFDNSAEDEKGSYDGTETDIEYRFGRFGQAAVFNGSSSKIVASSYNINLSTVSVSYWFKDEILLGLQFYKDSQNHVAFGSIGSNIGMYARIGNSFNHTASTTSRTQSGWNHLVFVLGGGNIKVYLNGNTTPIINTTKTYNISATKLNISTLEDAGGPYYYANTLDQVRIYSTALTSSQVTELYNEKPEVDTSNFKAVLYQGNGSSQYISNVGFQPDLVWIKDRFVAEWHGLMDSVRGSSQILYSNATNAENSGSDVTSFDSNGFSLTNNNNITNRNGDSYVSWNWKGSNADAVLNQEGTTNSQVSANTEAGFSIVKYTGAGDVNVGHGLSATPNLIISKITNVGASWVVYNSISGTGKYLVLDDTASIATASEVFSAVTDTTFTHNWSGNSYSYIAYCFHSVVGYSKIGSYNGSNSPISIITGFRPAFLMVKRTNATSNWLIIDSARATGSGADALYPNSSAAESTNWNTSFDSNGFTISSNEAWLSASGGNYIYMAFK